MLWKKIKRILASASLVLLAAQSFASNDDIDSKVDSLLEKMTLAEKIGQMNQYNGFWDATGPAPEEGFAKLKYDHLRSGLVGSVLNVSGYERVRELQEVAVNETRLGIPLIFGLDVIHGHKTIFPIPLAESASWDMDAIERSARVGAVESAAQGINWTFAPMVDISEDARWGRVAEGAGEDPYLGAHIGVARIKGFQGEDLAAVDTIAACAKHFAGYGFAEGGRDYNRVDVSPYTLHNTILPPFKAAAEAGVKTFMNSFNTLNGIPATGSAFLQREILKGKWGFEGFVVSDWASIRELIAHSYAEDDKQAAEIAVKAGSDMDMEGYAYINHLEQLVKEGKVDEALINDAARRVLRVKFELGLFEDPYRYSNQEREQEWLNHKTHMAAARDVAKRSIVLLKNESSLLPLSKKQKNIAVIGPLANDKNSPLGTWRVSADDNTAISLVEGLKQYNENFQYEQGVKFSVGKETFADQIEVNETDRTGFEEAKQLAQSSDVVIMMLGEHGFQSGEGRSRTKIDLPGLQQELLEEIYAVNKNIILLVSSGRPLDLSWAHKHIPTIVQTWQLGTQSGNAIADVLFGEYNPSGKLPMSFPRSVGQLPTTYRLFSTGRGTPKPVVFWSHYIDEESDALYPFGHGLSYTTFEYSKLKVKALGENRVQVKVNVKNTGKSAGEEVVQLYIRDRFASTVRPVKELKGFEKISLASGKSKTVTFMLTEKELGFYNAKGEFLVEKGAFDVMVGGGSVGGETAQFEL
ncbi:beta-glucosidase BglX [Teredinibacter haidensis]|uniref:beta-glucosidase BglX n=1 Tax=Teredinibacter haidensis TaxID=2731755 RepID=UPI0009489227|nr:beta-glucosidase BglX [Teredinibacter haidensis]